MREKLRLLLVGNVVISTNQWSPTLDMCNKRGALTQKGIDEKYFYISKLKIHDRVTSAQQLHYIFWDSRQIL